MSQTALGVIGAGRIGRMHTENLIHRIPEAEVRAVASPHLDEGWAEGLRIPNRSTDNSAVFGDPEIDACVVIGEMVPNGACNVCAVTKCIAAVIFIGEAVSAILIAAFWSAITIFDKVGLSQK